jgi:hypothetical protein
MLNYHGIKTPDGLGLFRVLDGPHPAELPSDQFWPVNDVVPEGMTRTGWQLIDGIVQPTLVPTPSISSSTVPSSVSPRQIRRALTVAGLRTTVEAAVSAADQNTRDDWEFANEVRRDWPVLNQMATSLGMTSEQVDALFIAAAQF